MENLVLSFNVVLPLFLMMSLGYFLKYIKLYDDYVLKVINNVTFKVFLPVLLFYNIYKMDLNSALSLKLLTFAFVSVFIIFVLTFFVIMAIEKDNKKRGVLIQAIFRSNFLLFGLPVTIALFGDKGAGITTLLIAAVVPVFNVLSVITLEIFRDGKIDVRNICKGIITNPLIIASALGLILLVFSIPLPKAVVQTAGDIGKIATPLALIVLGGSFSLKKTRGNIKQIIIGVTGRLVVVPLIGITSAVFLGFRGVELVTILAMFASPTAVSSFTMAEQMESDGELAGQLVFCSVMFSILTVFLWVLILKQMNLI